MRRLDSTFVIRQSTIAGWHLSTTSKRTSGSSTLNNILRIHGINPPVLQAHHDLYRAVMYGHSPLSRVQREMLAVAVSALNGCHY